MCVQETPSNVKNLSRGMRDTLHFRKEAVKGMQQVLLVIHLILAVAIIVLVLLQRSEGGGLVSSGGGGMGGLMSSRHTADLLTRLTSTFAMCFFLTSLLLAILASRQAPEKSLMDTLAAGSPAVEATSATEDSSENATETTDKTPEPVAPSAPISE